MNEDYEGDYYEPEKEQPYPDPPFCFGDYEWDSSDECQGCFHKQACEKENR